MFDVAILCKKRKKTKRERNKKRMHFPLYRSNQVVLVIYRIAVYFVECTVAWTLVNGIVWHAVIGRTSSARDIVSTSMAAHFAFRDACIHVATSCAFPLQPRLRPRKRPLGIMRSVTSWSDTSVRSCLFDKNMARLPDGFDYYCKNDVNP